MAAPISKVKKLVPLLLSWFSTNARDLPWRRTSDPYAIWVSEIMLQQTQVKTVIPYWERWMRELPTIRAAAQSSPARLHKLWEGLGYYTRVRNLQRAAKQIIARHVGQFPENFADILALPGIGRYTAGAIASIAFNQPRPILDGNVTRVLTRIFGITTDPLEKQTNARLWQLAEELVTPAKGAKSAKEKSNNPLRPSRPLREANTCSHLNQSLMELGALICTPCSPNCAACPVQKLCVARKKNLQEQIPSRGKRAKTTGRRFLAFLVERDGNFLVCQRPAGVVNAHLWEFPNAEVEAGDGRARHSVRGSKLRRDELYESPIVQNIAEKSGTRITRPSEHKVFRQRHSVRAVTLAIERGAQRTDAPCQLTDFRHISAKPLCTIKHSITRYRITLEARRAQLAKRSGKIPGRWLTLKQLHRLAFTSAHKKILARLEFERPRYGRALRPRLSRRD